MPEAYVRRGTSLAPNQSSKPNANPVYVDSAKELLTFGVGASGVVTRKSIDFPVVTYLVDAALVVESSIDNLTKATAGAYTLAAPTAAQNGLRKVITAGTAAAHVVTATGLIQDGVTGGAKTTLTFGAFVGASVELVAVETKWHVVGKNVVTIT